MLKSCLIPGFIVCMIFSSCMDNHTKEKPADVVSKNPDSIITDTFPRKNITFILGKDDNMRNPYYSLANDYYRLSDSEKTEIVIDTMISLLEVRNYLDKYRPEDGHPWGTINLVTHGNEFIDISVYVTPTGSRVSEKSLLKAIADSVIKPLDTRAVDKKTVFHLHGCAIGNNTVLLNLLGITFGGIKSPAKMQASKLFEYYAYTSQNKNPQTIKHYYAQVWYAYYNVDSFLDEETLVNQLKKKYPNDNIDWVEAIRRQYQSTPSEAYHMNLKIPVVWEDFYESKSQLPDLRTKAKQLKWLEGKTEFLDLVKKTRIPREYFRIKYYTLVYSRDSGTIYSNKVKGMAGVICIIKPLIGKDDSQNKKYIPFVSSSTDSTHFGFASNSGYVAYY